MDEIDQKNDNNLLKRKRILNDSRLSNMKDLIGTGSYGKTKLKDFEKTFESDNKGTNISYIKENTYVSSNEIRTKKVSTIELDEQKNTDTSDGLKTSTIKYKQKTKMSKLNKYLNYLIKSIIYKNQKRYDIDFKNTFLEYDGFDEFEKSFEWDLYEYIIIKALGESNNRFRNFSESTSFYLEDKMGVLLDKELYSFVDFQLDYSIIEKEMRLFIEKKQKMFKKFKLDISFINNTNIFYYTSLVYYQIKDEKELDFTDFDTDNLTNQVLLSAIKFSENIIKLNLSTNKLSHESCYWLGYLLKTNKNLLDLDISSCEIDYGGLKLILTGLEFNEKSLNEGCLTKLNICKNKLNEKSGKYLGFLLIYFRRLELFNISGNKIFNQGLFDLLLSYQCILEYELIDKNNIFLINNNALETFILGDIGIYNEGSLKFLGDLLTHPRCRLKSLILSKNKIGINNPKDLKNGVNHMKYFLKSLQENKTITELYMLNCEIGNNLADYFYEMLISNKNIEYLTLFNNNINNEYLFVKIISVFSCFNNKEKVNSTLKSLDLGKNNCQLKECYYFYELIGGLQLKSLDLSQNSFSKEVVTTLNNLTKRLEKKTKITF